MTTAEDNNTGLDFGSGNVVPMPSRCLRVASEPSDCDMCAQFCPANAITPKPFLSEVEENEEETKELSHKTKAQLQAEKKVGIIIDHDACYHCAVCTTVCPMEALSSAKQHPKGLEKQVKDISDKFEGLAIGCARALYGVPPRLSEHVIKLPCLGAITAEGWFLAAAFARGAVYDPRAEAEEVIGNLKVLLPPLLCSDCPINEDGGAEETYTAVISEAEGWGADNIELISDAEELPFYFSGRLISTLSDVASDGKRELVEQLAADFTRSWKSAGDDLTRKNIKAELLAEKRKKLKVVARPDVNAARPFGKKSQRRSLLKTAMQLEDYLIDDVELLCADTDYATCSGCGECVKACPLNARRRISGNSVMYFGKLPEEERPKESQAAVTDQLCCLGCSACVQVCPTGACKLSWLNGRDFYNLRTT